MQYNAQQRHDMALGAVRAAWAQARGTGSGVRHGRRGTQAEGRRGARRPARVGLGGGCAGERAAWSAAQREGASACALRHGLPRPRYNRAKACDTAVGAPRHGAGALAWACLCAQAGPSWCTVHLAQF